MAFRAGTAGRADDTIEVVGRRLDVYARQTLPPMELCRERGMLVEVVGVGSTDDVTRRLASALGVVLKVGESTA